MILIVAAQLINLTLTLIVIYNGLNELGAAIASGACIAVYFVLNESLQWGYAYVYWVTSQKACIVYKNMDIMYSREPTEVKKKKF